jgi:iron complex outermembrane receptor protein
MKIKPIILINLPFALAPLAGAAQEAVQLSPVVVTATRGETELRDSPATMSVITSQDMERRNLYTFDQAINAIPGVYAKRSKGIMDATPRISIRGLPDQKRTLVLVDGVPINDSYTGDVDFGSYDLSTIDRIEVVEGGFSSLYGGNAMGGVVNLITRRPESDELNLSISRGDGFATDGAMSDVTQISLGHYNVVNDKFGFGINFQRQSTDGYASNLVVRSATQQPTSATGAIETTTTNGSAKRYIVGDTGDNSYQSTNASLSLRFKPADATTLDFLLGTGKNGYDYKNPHSLLRDSNGGEVFTATNGTTTVVSENNYLSGPGGNSQTNYGMNLKTVVGAGIVSVNAGYIDRTDDWYITPGTAASVTRTSGAGKVSNTPSTNTTIDGQVEWAFGEQHTVTAGVSYRAGSAHNQEQTLTNWTDRSSATALTYEAKGKERSYAGFLQEQYKPNKYFVGYLGLRQDVWKAYDGYANDVGKTGYPQTYSERSASELSPKAALVVKPFDNTTLRTSYGTSFRTPTVYELYRTWVSSSTTVFSGNPDLKPETTTSWELGLDQELFKVVTVRAVYFNNDMEDFIYRRDRVDGTVTYKEYVNAAKAESSGYELGLSVRLPYGLSGFGNYTKTDATVKSNPSSPNSVGKQITGVPEKMINVGGTWEWRDFSATGVARYVSKRYGSDDNSDSAVGVYGAYDAYKVADVKLNYRFTKTLSGSVAVDNIFDEEHYDFYLAPGRSWLVSVNARFL